VSHKVARATLDLRQAGFVKPKTATFFPTRALAISACSPPLPSENGTTLKVLLTFALNMKKPDSDSGPSFVIMCYIARQRTKNLVKVWVNKMCRYRAILNEHLANKRADLPSPLWTWRTWQV